VSSPLCQSMFGAQFGGYSALSGPRQPLLHLKSQVRFHATNEEYRMSSHAGANVRPDVDVRPSRRVNTETKASFKTTELIVYVLSVLGVLIASQVVNDGDFNAKEAWFFVTLLTIGYMVSRGLAKSGSRDFDDDRG
jgi:hypothetical protein